MKGLSVQSVGVSAESPSSLPSLNSPLLRRNVPWELPFLMAALVLLNLPLFFGGNAVSLAYHPQLIEAGEWWRVVTYSWVHVSWYHFALDGVAFFCAYSELSGHRLWKRLTLVASASAGALLIPFLFSPLIVTHGLCGLSGVDHGLAAVVGLEMWRSKGGRAIRLGGLACFLGVTGKSIFEAWTGNILFSSWHLDSLGTPIALCHLGGIVGALLVWFCFFHWRRS